VLAHFPGLMLLLLDGLQGHRVVGERVLDVAEVRFVADHFFAAGAIEETGAQHSALLVVSQIHGVDRVVAILTVVLYIAFGYIRQPLVDEAT